MDPNAALLAGVGAGASASVASVPEPVIVSTKPSFFDLVSNDEDTLKVRTTACVILPG